MRYGEAVQTPYSSARDYFLEIVGGLDPGAEMPDSTVGGFVRSLGYAACFRSAALPKISSAPSGPRLPRILNSTSRSF